MQRLSPRPFARAVAARPASRVARVLESLGAEPGLVDAVLGDLTEERALRAAREGATAARWWYVREALRAVPCLVRNALRHGDPAARARVATLGATAALTVGVVATVTHNGPPARLDVDLQTAEEGVVVNNVLPVRLPVRVLDAAGHRLTPEGVRFRWEAGTPIAVSPEGDVTCARRGDASVRASLGDVAASILVRCRPVDSIASSSWISLVVGGGDRVLPFQALDAHHRAVTQLRGDVRVLDASVATFAGSSVTPRAAGETAIRMHLGNRWTQVRVLVHEPVRSFQGLRPDQRLVAVPVRLARGDTLSFALPYAVYWLRYVPKHAGEAPPTIAVHGLFCMPSDGVRDYRIPRDEIASYCVPYAHDARVTVGHGDVGAPVVDGWLAVERVDVR